MSSDTSSHSKSDGVQKTKSVSKNKKPSVQSSMSESDDRQTSRGSKESKNSFKTIPQPKITVLEQLSYKTSDAADLCSSDEQHKGTSTTYNSTAPTVITAVLRDLREDVVHARDYRQASQEPFVNGDRAIAVIGGDNIYVQNKSKFIPVPREKALSIHQHDQDFWTYQTSKLEEHSPLDVAMFVQRVFTPISSICFGLLGGVALLQLILVHHLISGMSDEDNRFFLNSYSRFAELTPLLFYILLAVCIVSVLDRVPFHLETIVCQPSWIVVAVYALTLILTLSCASYDDMIALYPQNKTLFPNQMKTHQLVSEWQLLNTLRCVFAILGWVLFSLTSPPDLMLQHLAHVKQYEENKQPTPNTTINSLP